VDKISCLAFILYQSSESQGVKKRAIQLLNGDVTIRELKMNLDFQSLISHAEFLLKKNEFDRNKVQKFIEQYMLVEI
jgi:hypothetical protein